MTHTYIIYEDEDDEMGAQKNQQFMKNRLKQNENRAQLKVSRKQGFI